MVPLWPNPAAAWHQQHWVWTRQRHKDRSFICKCLKKGPLRSPSLGKRYKKGAFSPAPIPAALGLGWGSSPCACKGNEADLFLPLYVFDLRDTNRAANDIFPEFNQLNCRSNSIRGTFKPLFYLGPTAGCKAMPLIRRRAVLMSFSPR